MKLNRRKKQASKQGNRRVHDFLDSQSCSVQPSVSKLDYIARWSNFSKGSWTPGFTCENFQKTNSPLSLEAVPLLWGSVAEVLTTDCVWSGEDSVQGTTR